MAGWVVVINDIKENESLIMVDLDISRLLQYDGLMVSWNAIRPNWYLVKGFKALKWNTNCLSQDVRWSDCIETRQRNYCERTVKLEYMQGSMWGTLRWVFRNWIL